MQNAVTRPTAWAQPRRHWQRATSSARALKKDSTAAAPRSLCGLWQHATPSAEGGQHRRHTTRAKWRWRQPPSENLSTFTPPRGLNVERSEKAKLSHGKRGASAPPKPPKLCCRSCCLLFCCCCSLCVLLLVFRRWFVAVMCACAVYGLLLLFTFCVVVVVLACCFS